MHMLRLVPFEQRRGKLRTKTNAHIIWCRLLTATTIRLIFDLLLILRGSSVHHHRLGTPPHPRYIILIVTPVAGRTEHTRPNYCRSMHAFTRPYFLPSFLLDSASASGGPHHLSLAPKRYSQIEKSSMRKVFSTERE